MSRTHRDPPARLRVPRLAALLVAAGAACCAAAVSATTVTVTLPTVTVAPGGTAEVRLEMDRDISGLSVYSIEYRMPIDPAIVSGVAFMGEGVINGWGTPFRNAANTFIAVLGAGTTPTGSHSRRLDRLQLAVSPSAPLGADMPLTLSILAFNEGVPASAVVSGVLQVRNTVDVMPGGGPSALRVAPNPVVSRALVTYTLPPGVPVRSPMRLAIYAIDGRRVRTLTERITEGQGSAPWNARDDAGRTLAPGVYLCRLEWRGGHLERRLAIVR